MNDRTRNDMPDEEQQLESIFRHATPRPRPGGAARARAYAALHSEWQSQARAGMRRRRWRHAGLAAGVLLAAMAAMQWLGGDIESGAMVPAEVLRASGDIEINGNRIGGDQLAGRSLSPGDRVTTFASSRVALDWGGASLRLDRETTVQVARGGRVQLQQGALYFDSQPFGGSARTPARLTVETPLGDVHHVGTQFLTDLRDGRLGVNVREGEVRISGERVDVTVNAGEAAQLFADGRFDRRPLAAHDERWHWAANIAPEADLSGRTTAEVLGWIARETGREVRYASPAARERASHEPRGIASLAPLPALRTLPFMTSLSTQLTDRYIVVDVAEDSGATP